MAETFTLILTKGMHVISAAAAVKIKDALSRQHATVDVELDPFGGFHTSRVTTIAVGHIVALTVNPAAEEMAANVVAIAKRAGLSKR